MKLTMTRLKKGALILLLASMSVPSALQAKELKVLTIGNSFADSVFRYLPAIVKSVPDCSIKMGRANIGGCSLDKHWNEVLKSEENPTYKPYRRKNTLKDLLQSEKWDIVTLQQVSSKSFKPKTYEPYFGNLYNYVRKYAPQAEIMIQMTWSYRPDHHAFGKWAVDDPTDMFNKLYDAYTAIATKYKCPLIPSGLALHLARKNQKDAFQLPEQDVRKLKHPQKIEKASGSFVRGYYWRKKNGEYKLGSDKIHLNSRGQYLQACVWFARIFDKPTTTISFAPKNMPTEDLAFLKDMAQKAVDQIKEVQSQ
jgi:hypothetical protein